MLIVVIVRKTLKSCFNEIKSSAAGTGIMGLMVNSTVFLEVNNLTSIETREIKAAPPSV
jgi:hypothetical protein